MGYDGRIYLWGDINVRQVLTVVEVKYDVRHIKANIKASHGKPETSQDYFGK